MYRLCSCPTVIILTNVRIGVFPNRSSAGTDSFAILLRDLPVDNRNSFITADDNLMRFEVGYSPFVAEQLRMQENADSKLDSVPTTIVCGDSREPLVLSEELRFQILQLRVRVESCWIGRSSRWVCVTQKFSKLVEEPSPHCKNRSILNEARDEEKFLSLLLPEKESSQSNESSGIVPSGISDSARYQIFIAYWRGRTSIKKTFSLDDIIVL